MSKYLDDRTVASQPGDVGLSVEKLRILAPRLTDDRAVFKCGDLCDADHPAAEMRDRIDDALRHGCASPALVMSVEPLVIAVYTTDLDACALLSFPGEARLVERYSLSPGSPLLAICTFTDLHDRSGAPLFAADLLPGPERVSWSNFVPLIADFLTDDLDGVARGKAMLPPLEWERAADRARIRIERLGLSRARDGRPPLTGVPASGPEHARYVREDRSPAEPRFDSAPAAEPSSRWLRFVVTAIFVALMGWLVRQFGAH